MTISGFNSRLSKLSVACCVIFFIIHAAPLACAIPVIELSNEHANMGSASSKIPGESGQPTGESASNMMPPTVGSASNMMPPTDNSASTVMPNMGSASGTTQATGSSTIPGISPTTDNAASTVMPNMGSASGTTQATGSSTATIPGNSATTDNAASTVMPNMGSASGTTQATGSSTIPGISPTTDNAASTVMPNMAASGTTPVIAGPLCGIANGGVCQTNGSPSHPGIMNNCICMCSDCFGSGGGGDCGGDMPCCSSGSSNVAGQACTSSLFHNPVWKTIGRGCKCMG